MKSTKKTLIALAIAATMGISGAATAGTLASSTFSITNFLLSNAGTGATLSTSDFTVLVATNNGGVASSLVGVGSAGSNFNLPLNDPNTDLLRACVGGGCGVAPAENNFMVLTPPPVGTFANADQLLVGSALNLGPVPTTGANAFVRGDVSLASQGDGTANADVGLNATFLFSLVNNINLGVTFNGAVDLIAFTDLTTTFPGNAQASSSLAIVLTEFATGNEVFSFGNTLGSTGCGLNRTINRNAPFNGTSSYSCNGVFAGTSGVLTAGTTYQFSLRQNANADALFVPEPGVLSLMGLGLLGMGAALRKRKAA